MRAHRRKLLPLCIAASLLSGLSHLAAAIGVGEIHLQSFLGAPLQAEVPLSHLGDLDIAQIKVQLGTQSDYSAMNVDYAYLHTQFDIEPIVKNGQGYVRISTREPITEPYLNFVLSLRWPQGQLVREFTVLLDPPAQAVATTALPASAPAAPEAPVTALVTAAETTAIAAAQPVPQPQRRARIDRERPAAVAPSDGSYRIQRGDSLWRIANRVRPAQMPVEQVMAAIHTLNPDAFINGNPGLLKEAVTIALPDAAQIAAVAGAASRAGAGATARVAVRASGDSAAAQPALAASALPVDKLVEENSSLKTQVADLNGNVAALNDNLMQSEQRLHQLESQLKEVLMQMQQQRATLAELSGAAVPASAGVQSAGSVINQVNASDLGGSLPVHTPWWVHLLYWLGIGGAVTWAVREHFWPQRRLAAAVGASDTNMNYEASMDYAATSLPAAARGPVSEPRHIGLPSIPPEFTLDLDTLPSAAEPVPRTSFEKEEDAPQLLRTGDEPVDISISAGVFVAFGRFADAERLLRDALAREPARIDLKLQLLDVLMQSDQPGAFDDLAADIEKDARTPEELAELAVLRDSYRSAH